MSHRAPPQKLGEVVEIVKGTVPAKVRHHGEGVPYFGLHEIAGGGAPRPAVVSAEDVPAGAPRLKRGDIAIALMSNVRSSVRIGAHLEGSVLGKDCVALRPRVPEITSAWIFAWTQSTGFRSQVERHVSGVVTPRLSLTALAEFTVPVPDREMQLAVQGALDDLQPAIAAAGRLLADLTELRQIETELILNQAEPGPPDG